MKHFFTIMLLFATFILASCQKEKPVTHVSEVAINETALTLAIGEKAALTATITPKNATNKSVTWSSSNTLVATVSENGEVSAKEAGTATITLMSGDNQSKIATCLVTVAQEIIEVTLIGINNKPLSMLVNDTDELLVTVLPDNATDQNLTWSSNDVSVATVSETGTVIATGTGVATITVVSVSDNTKTDQCVVTVTAPIVTTAAIGNYYYSDKTQTKIYDKTKSCLGVVFWIDPTNAQKGKIVSLDEQELEWSVESETTGATNNTNGKSNMYQINQFVRASRNSVWENYPAFNWVATKKNARLVGGWENTDMWYLPAQGDLVALFGNDNTTVNIVNTSFKAIPDAVALTPGLYCSSTEKNESSAIFVSLSTGYSQDLFKFSANKVRAMAEF